MKCLIKGCEKNAVCRGLCWNHYQMAYHRCGQDKNEWSNLIARGLALPTAKAGRKAKNPFCDLPGQMVIPDAVYVEVANAASN